MPPKLIVVYAGFGDTLLLENENNETNTPSYWLIDGGPVTSSVGKGSTRIGGTRNEQGFHPYYQFLKQALLRFCSSDGGLTIDRLSGIIVTHPHRDHMDGIIQLIADWLPNPNERTESSTAPLKSFKGPVILNNMFFTGEAERKTLYKLLHTKGFRRKNIDSNDESIPAPMSNVSHTQKIWKMVYAPDQQDEKLDKKMMLDGDSDEDDNPVKSGPLTVDASKENEPSIITTWNDEINPAILTTGDTIGARVLSRLNNLQLQNSVLGIFKIPHHGSQRNSQINRANDLSSTDSEREENHYFFLALACWYLRAHPTRFNDEEAAGLIEQAIADVEANWQDEWIHSRPQQDRNVQQFAAKMGELAGLFRDYLKDRSFVCTDPANPNTRFHLATDDGLKYLTVLVARRHFTLLDCVYRGDRNEAEGIRGQDYMGNIKGVIEETPWSKRRTPRFNVKDFKEDYVPVQQSRAPDGTITTRRNKREPGIEDLVTCLLDDPSGHVQYQMGIIDFYRRVRARNYAISANGAHQHPHPNTVAGLIMAAIEGPGEKCQLIMTDGAALKFDRIRAIVRNLLEKRQKVLPPEKWKDKIGVYYLETDYCASIPAQNDLPDIVGCKELDFGSAGDAETRDILHKQFTRTSAYDVPRASEPRHSSFELLVVQGTAPRRALSFDNATKTFRLADSSNLRTLFRLTAVDPYDPKPFERTKYLLSGVTRGDKSIPIKVAFSLKAGSSAKTGAIVQMSDDKGNILSYNPDNTTLSFRPPEDARVALLQFDRKEGFGTGPTQPASYATAALPLSRALASPGISVSPSSPSESHPVPHPESYSEYPAERPIELVEESSPNLTPESFQAWWKRVSPGSSASDVRLHNVAVVVFGEKQAQSVLKSLPSTESGFIFADIGGFQVDVDASPPVPRAEHESLTVACVLVLDRTIRLPGFAGLDSVDVVSLRATMSAKDSTLNLDANVSGAITASCHFSFGGKTSLERFLGEVDGQLDAKKLTLAELGAIIVGPEPLWAFFSYLPGSLSSAISLPTLRVDGKNTVIDYTRSPFGLDVSKASIALVIGSLASMSIGTFSFAPVSATLDIVSKYADVFDIALKFVAEITLNSKKLQCSFTATSDGVHPVLLDFVIGRSSPSDILGFLGFGTPLPPLSIPLDGGDRNLSIALDTVGFTLVQPAVGSTGHLDLSSVYFRLSAGSWKPWEKVLPGNIQPKQTQELDLTVALVRPKAKSSFAVGIQVDYAMDIDATHAKLLFRMSHWPIQGVQNSYRTSVGFRNDHESGLTPPSINDVLTKLTNTGWKQVTEAIPILDSVSKSISITQGSLEIDDGKKISGFSIHAQIKDLVLLSSPSLTIEAAGMILDYNGTSWNGYFASEFLFADKFRCTTEVVLPSANYPGRVSFKNSDDTFTCSELAKAIDPSIDLSTVPVIGGDLLASLRLDQASIEITYADGKYSISSFMIALDWGAWNIGQLKTSNNRLSISWRKESSSEPDGSTEGTETTLAETTSTENTSTWAIGWEGNLFTDWHLSANLHRSTTKVSEGESKTATILFGAILGPVERIHSGSLINSLTSASDNSNDPLWNQTVPKNVKSSFQLAECAVGLVLREDSQTFAAGARATWGENGQGTGLVLVEKSKATTEDSASKWGFAFAISVSNFRFTDLMSNNSFAQSVDDTLSIKRVSILVFRNPGGMGLSRIYQLVKNASACGLLPAGVDLLPPKSPNKKSSPELTAGAAVFALLHFPSAKEGSLTHNLNTVGGSKLSSVEIMGYFGKATDKTPTTIFSASISSISLFQSVILEEVKLTYAPVSSIDEEKLDDVANAFSLSANCRIQFSSESTWDIKGSFTITKKDAKLVADLTTGTRSLSETLGLQIPDVRFAVDYTFSSSPDPSKEGADKPESRKHKSTITLAAKAQIGSITADASVEFDDGKPGVLSVRVPGKLSVSDLFNRIFGTSISKDLLDIEFSKLLVYYAWKASKASTGQDEPESPTYTAGFHAEADTSIFGVLFSLAVDISGGEDKGFSISGTKATPVEVLGLVLHGATSEAAGPRLRFSTRAKDKGCSIEAGLKLFGTSVGSITLAYNSQKSQFLGTVGVKAKFLPGGQASVSFELVKKDEKHVLRLVELPAVFDDLVKAMHIIETIKKLSAADGSPCGAITLAFNQLSTKLHVKLTIPESQKGLSPDKGSEGGSKLNLNINGSFDISIFNHSITSIEFEPFLISIDIPKSFTLDAFASSVVSSLEKSAEQIVQGLWDNQGKLDEVIALVALEKIGEKAIKTLVCRGKYRPKSNPRDKPGRDQKPRGGDGGGSSGDGLFGGIFWPGSSSGSSRKRKPRPSEPSWPPPTPPEGDVIGQHIYEAITKDFTRWKRCTDYQQAIDTALACALEYREAIFLLRKVLRSAESVLKLGERVYNDYNQRLDLLVYDFSMLKWQFGEQWLDMADYEVELKAHSSTTNGRKLDISWNNLRLKGPMRTAVTAQIEGEAEPRLELKSFENSTRTTIDIPVFSGSENLAVKVQVWAIGEVRGGDPEYVFRSWGELAYGILDEVSVGTEVLDFNSKFSQFTLHSSAGSLTANGHIPVLLLGSYRYWPMNYVDNRSAVGLVAQSVGTLNETKRWKRDGDNSISSITHDASTVTFIGQHAQGVKFTLDELSLPDSRYLRTRIAIRDATSQPSLPFEGPSYEASVKDTKKYPVALAGTRTWWPMLCPDSPTLISLVGYDSDLQFIERIDWELDSVGGRIDRLNHIQDPGNPDNNRVEVYNTEGGRITSFGFEGLYS